ncbi:hypothetical protein [Bifidobacterium sp. SO1]|uniref:hypothetical protein n=1 Tax=Bifidobacterium sp. SO1 TaxID=2809029 RepID=UPI001BDD8F55|nr:hypothetical protein [Bifidobacterium sp. SO1]MBT1162958.1 hypothetical protein [Bifidobacterium sp. SO1]
MKRYEYKYPETVHSKSKGDVPFDPAGNGDHRIALERRIAQWKTRHPEAKDAVLESIDRDRHIAILVDRGLSVVTGVTDTRKEINLSADQQKPSKGEEVRTVYENKYEGWTLTEFHPYEGKAVIERLSDGQKTTRGILATAMGLHDWDLTVQPTDEGGWKAVLDDGIVYQPDKWDGKVEAACAQIGRYGWWHETDVKTGVIIIHPGLPKTFPKLVKLPFDTLGADRERTPFGVKLARPGDEAERAILDWKASPSLYLGGLPGSGKSNAGNAIIADQLATGQVELFVVDHFTKAADYYWARPWIHEHGWGCDSLLQTLGVLKTCMADIDKGGARAEFFRRRGYQNWYQLTDEEKQQMPLRLVVCDEFTQLTVGHKSAGALPKTALPPVWEEKHDAQVKELILRTVTDLVLVGRAYGYRVMLLNQVASAATGMPPSLRSAIGNKTLMGARASKGQRGLVFNIPESVPECPDNVFQEGVSKGVGSAEFEGQTPFVFKSYFPILPDGTNDAKALGTWMCDRLGLPEGIDRGSYLDSFDQTTADDPEFNRLIMSRVSFPESKTYELFPFLGAIRDKWNESLDEYGGGPTGDDTSHDDGDDGGTTPITSRSESGPEPSGPLMDAMELARVMRQG